MICKVLKEFKMPAQKNIMPDKTLLLKCMFNNSFNLGIDTHSIEQRSHTMVQRSNFSWAKL